MFIYVTISWTKRDTFGGDTCCAWADGNMGFWPENKELCRDSGHHDAEVTGFELWLWLTDSSVYALVKFCEFRLLLVRVKWMFISYRNNANTEMVYFISRLIALAWDSNKETGEKDGLAMRYICTIAQSLPHMYILYIYAHSMQTKMIFCLLECSKCKAGSLTISCCCCFYPLFTHKQLTINN